MIRRTSKSWVKDLLTGHPEWAILDLGCGRYAWEEATHHADRVDHSDLYKHHTVCDAHDTPYEDNQFDFVICSHIAEHMPDMPKFLNEVSRIGKAGYIEVPSPFFENLTFGNMYEHCWWVEFDDGDNHLTYTTKMSLVKERLWPEELKRLEDYFRTQMVTQLYWEDDIQYKQTYIPAELIPPEGTHADLFPSPLVRELAYEEEKAGTDFHVPGYVKK